MSLVTNARRPAPVGRARQNQREALTWAHDPGARHFAYAGSVEQRERWSDFDFQSHLRAQREGGRARWLTRAIRGDPREQTYATNAIGDTVRTYRRPGSTDSRADPLGNPIEATRPTNERFSEHQRHPRERYITERNPTRMRTEAGMRRALEYAQRTEDTRERLSSAQRRRIITQNTQRRTNPAA